MTNKEGDAWTEVFLKGAEGLGKIGKLIYDELKEAKVKAQKKKKK